VEFPLANQKFSRDVSPDGALLIALAVMVGLTLTYRKLG
jgi:hypothetical protein